MNPLKVQFIMHLNTFKGLLFVLSLIQNIIFSSTMSYSPLYTVQVGQVSGTRSLAVPGKIPQETPSGLVCIGSSQSSLCKRGKGREWDLG